MIKCAADHVSEFTAFFRSVVRRRFRIDVAPSIGRGLLLHSNCWFNFVLYVLYNNCITLLSYFTNFSLEDFNLNKNKYLVFHLLTEWSHKNYRYLNAVTLMLIVMFVFISPFYHLCKQLRYQLLQS